MTTRKGPSGGAKLLGPREGPQAATGKRWLAAADHLLFRLKPLGEFLTEFASAAGTPAPVWRQGSAPLW